jgi:flavin-dependent dehydrogenase
LDLDVAIIGASSAGLYAAEQLARGGRRVAVFERQPSLAPARRTLIVTPQLRHVLGYIPESAILHRIHTMEVATPGASLSVELQDPDLIVERDLLAQHLAGRAQQAGAELHYGYRFQGLAPHSAGVALDLRARDGSSPSVMARAVVGADGAFSDVAVAAGLKRPPVVPILQAEVALPPGWNPAVTKVWFDAAETRFFYWLVPESDARGVVGLVGDDQAETRALLLRFLSRHGFEPLAFQGAQVAMHHPRLRPWGQVGSAPVLLVGDAAGQVKVTTVGGTVTGLWGAAAAARALLGNAHRLESLRALKRELDVHWFIRLLLERLDNAGYDRLVRDLNQPVRALLGRRNRDAMAGAIWQVPLLQPGLLALGLRLLLRVGGRGASDAVAVVEPD